MNDVAWLSPSPQSTVAHAVPAAHWDNPWWPSLPEWYPFDPSRHRPCDHCIERLSGTDGWRPDPTRPPGHYTCTPPASPDDDARDETPLILIPATPLDVLDAIPGYLAVGEPPPAVPMPVWKFANVARDAGAEIVITYARAIIPPHLIKKTKVLEPAYLIDSFAARFRRPESPQGTFPYRPGVVGYAMWERKQKGAPPHGFASVGAGYRNAHTQGQFPGLTELSRLLKEGLL